MSRAHPLRPGAGGVQGRERQPVDGFERPAPPLPPLTRGMTGARVQALQQKLLAGRFITNADFRSGPGVFGPRTQAGVERLQQKLGLPVTGVANAATVTALLELLQPEKPAPVSTELTTPTLPLQPPHVGADDDEPTQPLGRALR